MVAGAGVGESMKDTYGTSPMRRGHVRVGAASSKRRREGGQRAQGRPSETVEGYRALGARLIARSGGWCEIHRRPCPGTEICHVVARSAGGADEDWNCYWGCRAANLQQQAPYVKGRLLVSRVGRRGTPGIEWVIVRATGKVAFRLGEYETLDAGLIVGIWFPPVGPST